MTGDAGWSAGGSLALAKRMGRYLTDELLTLYTADSKAYPIYTSVHVSLDVGADLSRRPHAQREPGRFSYFSEGISKGSTEEQVADMSEVLSDAVIDKVTGLSTRRNSGLAGSSLDCPRSSS